MAINLFGILYFLHKISFVVENFFNPLLLDHNYFYL